MEKIKELHLLENGKTIFDTQDNYIIPLYQRAYAWGDDQLKQLIEDINDVQVNKNYYIGSLIVARNKDYFEVIDGQQRLTSLFLLLSYLGFNLNKKLSFECRERSNYTLNNLHKFLDGTLANDDSDLNNIEPTITQGIKAIRDCLKEKKIIKEEFLKKLSQVILYRIEVPEFTDLNRYFEIMNTRGEQLEQHDILKANLIGYLSNEKDRRIFSKIWDACSEMTGYVQMNFDKKSRETIFKKSWQELPSNNWCDYEPISTYSSDKTESYLIDDIVKSDFIVDYYEETANDNSRKRFDSIIEFKHFLLHVIRIFISTKKITGTLDEKLLNNLLDDKKLLKDFNKVINEGVEQGNGVRENKELFSKTFILYLLRCRFLFDKYIIKREYTNDDLDGQWSLSELRVSGKQSQKKAYYKNTEFKLKNQKESTSEILCKKNLMLQSALRVSYTSPKVMHWITELLLWLVDNDCYNSDSERIINYGYEIEKIAATAVYNNFLKDCSTDIPKLGTETPHIVFNYLDYLLWERSQIDYGDFEFEFRNSVEHWYPQHPSKGTFKQWDDVDRFGNLCIIQRNVNSRFSNMDPEAKQSSFKEMISKGSLKLRLMSKIIEDNKTHPNHSASDIWKADACYKHEKEMLSLIKSRVEQICKVNFGEVD